jgi:hypothetical protein
VPCCVDIQSLRAALLLHTVCRPQRALMALLPCGRNCFNKKIEYISISVNGMCTTYDKYDDKVIAELDLK